MPSRIADLEPTLVFRHFDALTTIPRGSGDEARARDYVRSYAREHDFDTRVDGAGNIVVRVPATPGHEKAPPVVLQGHLDMVCEKGGDVAVDFAKDPIPAYVDGDHVRSRGTTLGADNGIGVAAALAVGEDPAAVHPPLELLFTIDEETGLTGAFNLSGNMLAGRVMLNLDSEDEGTLFVGCAGGGDGATTIPARRGPAPKGFRAVTVRVAGLKGGHSGLDIAKGRGNAIRIAARAIEAGLAGRIEDGLLCSLAAGSKKNAIPREATFCLFLPGDRVGAFTSAVSAFAATIRQELGAADPGVTVTAAAEPCDGSPIDGPASGRVLRLLLAIPHGPIAMSQDIPGLVETSTNLAVIASTDDAVTVLTNSRSSIATAMDAVRLSIKSIAELAGGATELSGQYPGWRPDMSSRVLGVCRDVWKRTAGKDAIVTAIHAGLECGVIGERVPGMDMISFGPDIRGAHSPDENVSIPSTKRFYEFLKAVLGEMA
jgi:dipeptidase D